MHRKVVGLWLALLALAFTGGRVFGQQLPPKPADQKFVQDYAGVFSSQSMAEMGRIQEQAFTNYDVPIIVVSIRGMAEYGYTGGDIAEFAKLWFDHWGIGKQGPDGKVINRGMLVLLSIQDRKVRIELGADWGRNWDGYCEAVVGERMVPRFKQGQYAQGVLDGMQALLDLAAKDPLEDLPLEATGPLLSQLPLKDLQNVKVSTSPLSGNHLLQATVIGIVMIGLSFDIPSARKGLLIGGIAVIAIAWLFWIFLLLVAVFAKSKSGGRSGGYSGGGFGGGFSGGGGASGSW